MGENFVKRFGGLGKLNFMVRNFMVCRASLACILCNHSV